MNKNVTGNTLQLFKPCMGEPWRIPRDSPKDAFEFTTLLKMPVADL